MLRCNWGEVHHLVGVAVTPVVCFIGDLSKVDIRPSPDEVAECFTVPLDLFLDSDRWIHKRDYAPMFTGKLDLSCSLLPSLFCFLLAL